MPQCACVCVYTYLVITAVEIGPCLLFNSVISTIQLCGLSTSWKISSDVVTQGKTKPSHLQYDINSA